MILVCLFWVTGILLVYTYVGYPLWLYLWSSLRKRPVASDAFEPPVTVVMAVHNEASSLARKLDNLLELEYPRDKLHIVVVSDASTDATEGIAESYRDRGISLLRTDARGGKHAAQGLGIARASTEFILFTDVAPLLDRFSVIRMMRNFADPEVACVGGEDRVIERGVVRHSESAYIRYDMALRRMESSVGSTVGVSGAFFGVRRSLCEPWLSDRSSDLQLALEAVRRGQRAINDETSLHFYGTTASHKDEFRRKARTMLNGLVVVMESLDLLNPVRFGHFSLQLFSHKLCRWISSPALIVLFIASVLLASHGVLYLAAAVAQTATYLLAALGLLMPSLQRYAWVRIPSFFALTNLATLVAWFNLLRGQSSSIWNPTARA